MKSFSIRFKIVGFILALAFIFQSMSEINSHTYTTGVDSYHHTCGCFGCWPSHLAINCDSYNSNWHR